MTKRIDKLTPEQKARMKEWADKWIAIGLSTEPADFEKATAAALRGYELANADKPMVVLRMGSPYAATVGGAYAWLLLKALKAPTSETVWAHVVAQVRDQVGAQVWAQVVAQVGAHVVAHVVAQVRDQVGAQAFEAAKGGLNNNGICNLWGYAASYISFFRDVCGLETESMPQFQVYEDLAQSCGWTWWHQNVLAISDRPLAIHRDSQNRLHNDSGPSIEYRDGWKLYHIHGIALTPAQSYIVESPDLITVEKIDAERNAEIRRVMVERYGAGRYLIDAGAKEVSRDGYGILLRREQADDEPIVVVRVLNSTPEPDGIMSSEEAAKVFGMEAVNKRLETMLALGHGVEKEPRWKEYFLRVDPSMLTPHQAIAWSFGLKPEQYRPEFES